jgi:uncharacterized 2Fe-2S/4Fe-4S cluster protein (DUF4445 family)
MLESERKTCTVHFEPSGLKTVVPQGANLLDAARKVGVYINSICGGDGYCGKCKVTIDSGQYDCKPTTLLTQQEQRENVVLACQTRVLSDLTVTIGKSHVLETDQILTDSEAYRFSAMAGQAESDFVLDPLVRKVCLKMSPPTVQDHTADHERIMVAIRDQVHAPVMQMGYRILQELPNLLQKNDYRVTATVGFRGGATEIVQIEPQSCCDTNYAVAVDLGTTTVVAHLVDLTTGQTLDTEATYNSQINFGEDYIRRIIYAEQNDAFDELQDRIVHDVNNLIVILAERNNIGLQEITAVICAGNTAMTHFLLNLDPTRIRREPYIASASVIPPLRAAEVGIHINKRGLIYFLPSVAAYVGGDIVAGVLATRLYAQDKLCLLVDIGTNGEVVLGNAEWIMCASSSAGPAFEGSGVKHGMRAATGAIEKLQIRPDGKIETQIIGDANPIGICGSGLLDTIAELFLHGIIDRTGRFRDREDSRLTESDEGKQFTLIPAQNGRSQIVITQVDINNLIRSKAGVFAAVKVLMETTQTQPQDLHAIYLAGGFGNYLNVERAVTVGLLPDIPPGKIHFVGNTSIAGAKLALLSRQAQAQAERIATAMTYTDLMSHPGYMEEFVQANFLPHTDLSLFPSLQLADSG